MIDSRFGVGTSLKAVRDPRQTANRMLRGPVAALGPRSGSVLVPVIAAMLILLMAGFALVELMGAQNHQSVLHLESTRAFWAAEAGLWHAAYEETDIASAVSFAGCTYTVTKSGDDYTATGVLNNATQVVSETFAAAGGGGGNPLDEDASAATADRKSAKKMDLNLVSISASEVVIESFSLSANSSTTELSELKLDDEEIWEGSDSLSLPTGTVTLNEGSTSDRTVGAGDSPRLEFEFDSKPSGTISYTLVLNFTDGSSSTIDFSVSW